MLLAAANSHGLWRWHAHPEVWVLIAGLALLYRYAIRTIGPTAVRDDEVVVTRSQLRWFVCGLVVLWAASDWPVHDIAERYLYSVHMMQHMVLSMVVPPMMLLGTPTWLARLVIGSGRGYRVIRWLTRLVPATFAFNVVVVLSHWPTVVQLSIDHAPVHFGMHLLLVSTSLLMWFGVAGPLPELRFTLPVQMAHLFLQSVVPTVPAGILVFAESVIYRSYDRVSPIWGMTAVEDQQMAAAMMKVLGSLYLWSVILMLFVRFAERSQADDRERGVRLDRRAPGLTWAEVEAELATAPPGPQEPSH